MRSLKGILAVIIAAALLIVFTIPMQAEAGHSSFISSAKRSVVFLGVIDDEGEPQFFGTGFLISVNNIFHLVTAKHVVEQAGGEDFHVFFNNLKGKMEHRSVGELREQYDLSWIVHVKPEVDIALIPFGLDMEVDDVTVIPDDFFLSSDSIYESEDVLFFSFQPGVIVKNVVAPVIRKGMISLISPEKTFIIDGTVFPGNSGAPVFLKPPFISSSNSGLSIGGDSRMGKFIGVVASYVPYRDVAVSQQTGNTRVIFEENTGLAVVWPVDYIKEIIKSKVFQKQLKRLDKLDEKK